MGYTKQFLAFANVILFAGTALASSAPRFDPLDPGRFGYEIARWEEGDGSYVRLTDKRTRAVVQGRVDPSGKLSLVEELSPSGVLIERQSFEGSVWTSERFSPEHVLVRYTPLPGGEVLRETTTFERGLPRTVTVTLENDHPAELNPRCEYRAGETFALPPYTLAPANLAAPNVPAPCGTTRLARGAILDNGCKARLNSNIQMDQVFTHGVARAIECMRDPSRADMTSTAAKFLLLLNAGGKHRDLRIYCSEGPNQESVVDRQAEPNCQDPAMATPGQETWSVKGAYARGSLPCSAKANFPTIVLNSDHYNNLTEEQRMAVVVHEMLHNVGFDHGQVLEVNNILPLCCFNFFQTQRTGNPAQDQAAEQAQAGYCKRLRDAVVRSQ